MRKQETVVPAEKNGGEANKKAQWRQLDCVAYGNAHTPLDDAHRRCAQVLDGKKLSDENRIPK